jgi:hypothetical protein
MSESNYIRSVSNLIALAFLCLYGDGIASDSIWRTQGVNAVATMKPTIAKDSETLVSLVVSFNPKLSCAAEIETIVMKGSALGTAKRQQWMKEQMQINVDNDKKWSERTAATEYSNGMAATFLGSDDLVQAMRNGKVAHTRTLPGTPIFEFPLAGAREAIDEAKRACRR